MRTAPCQMPPCVCGSVGEWTLRGSDSTEYATTTLHNCKECFRPGECLTVGEDSAFIVPRARVTFMPIPATTFITKTLLPAMLRNDKSLRELRAVHEHKEWMAVCNRLRYTHITDWTGLKEKTKDTYLRLLAIIYTSQEWWWPERYRPQFPNMPQQLVVHLRTNLEFDKTRPQSAWRI